MSDIHSLRYKKICFKPLQIPLGVKWTEDGLCYFLSICVTYITGDTYPDYTEMSQHMPSPYISPNHLSQILCQIPQFCLFHDLHYQMAKKFTMSIDRWMDKEDVAHIYNGILLSHKEKRNWVICSEVDGPRVCHTEWSQSEREKQKPYANIYIWNLKKKKNGSEEPRGRTGIKTQT